jgi:hypothetical protein
VVSRPGPCSLTRSKCILEPLDDVPVAGPSHPRPPSRVALPGILKVPVASAGSSSSVESLGTTLFNEQMGFRWTPATAGAACTSCSTFLFLSLIRLLASGPVAQAASQPPVQPLVPPAGPSASQPAPKPKLPFPIARMQATRQPASPYFLNSILNVPTVGTPLLQTSCSYT